MPTQKRKPKLKKPPILFAKTQRIVRAIAEETDGTFLTYWNSAGGSVCHNDVMGFYEVLQRIGHQDDLHLFIKSDGGDGTASLRIVNLLRRYAERLVAQVPLECASAATMVALGADEIQMGPLAFLTAVDTSITHDLSPMDVHNRRVSVSQDELNRAVKLWQDESEANDTKNPYAALFPHVHPLVIGAVDRSSSLSVKLCTEILAFHLTDKSKAEAISIQLNSAYPAHDYPIMRQEAQRVGLNVKDLDPEAESDASRFTRPLLGDGTIGGDRLRRAELPQQRGSQYHRERRHPGLLSNRQGLALPHRRKALGTAQRRKLLAES